MYPRELEIAAKLSVPISNIPEIHLMEAERSAREAFVMTLLRHHDISAGRASRLLGIDCWQLADLMSLHNISP
ncbi:MAG: hypothetical protein VKJ46_07160, partial [Leptolyngbyaceae bacterium]|nr:hypothetical protein [Leptolyngbyaceae bacterium]